MASHVILCSVAALLLTSSAWAEEPNPLEFMAKVGTAVEALGKNTICVANLAGNPEILAKAYASFDATVANVKATVHGPQSEQQFTDLVNAVVFDNAAAMRSVDPHCADVSKYCATSDPPAAAKTMAELGEALQTMGATLGCMIADPKPEVLAEIPVIVDRANQNVAAYNGSLITSVDILLPEIIMIVKGFQSLSPACLNVTKCHVEDFSIMV